MFTEEQIERMSYEERERRMKQVHEAAAKLREAGLQALCNWPDGTVANKLVEMATKGTTPEERTMALDALIRRLRDRLAALDPNQAYVDTVRGHGIRLDNPPA